MKHLSYAFLGNMKINSINNILDIPFANYNTPAIQNILSILNQEKILILSGMYQSGQSIIIKDLLKKSGQEKNCCIIDPDSFHVENIDGTKLIHTVEEYIKNANISLFVLNNCNKIKNIKDFLQYIYAHKKNFKIILIGNSFHIPGIKELEINPFCISKYIQKYNINDILSYGTLPDIVHINHIYYKKQFLELFINQLYTKEIIINSGVKDIELYKFVIKYVSVQTEHISLRDIHKGINEIQQITLKTTIDYIHFSLRAKLLKSVMRYDFKKGKEISSRLKYYFSDIGIRNHIAQNSLPQHEQQENLLFQHLHNLGYSIYTGINGTFQFTFYCQSPHHDICIHFSDSNDKIQIKKDINKLNKLPTGGKKYLIIDSLEKLNIRKTLYDDVELIEYKNIFAKILQEKKTTS